jgi:hypothetical protein
MNAMQQAAQKRLDAILAAPPTGKSRHTQVTDLARRHARHARADDLVVRARATEGPTGAPTPKRQNRPFVAPTAAEPLERRRSFLPQGCGEGSRLLLCHGEEHRDSGADSAAPVRRKQQSRRAARRLRLVVHRGRLPRSSETLAPVCEARATRFVGVTTFAVWAAYLTSDRRRAASFGSRMPEPLTRCAAWRYGRAAWTPADERSAAWPASRTR